MLSFLTILELSVQVCHTFDVALMCIYFTSLDCIGSIYLKMLVNGLAYDVGLELIFLSHIFVLYFLTHSSILIEKITFQIMEERSALSDPVSDGHVLVQFYGNHPRYCSISFPHGSFLDVPNLFADCTDCQFVALQCLG